MLGALNQLLYLLLLPGLQLLLLLAKTVDRLAYLFYMLGRFGLLLLTLNPDLLLGDRRTEGLHDFFTF